MAAERARLHLMISGRVQGVGFRFSAHDEARKLGLSGWVRNRAGGEVELVAEGDLDKLRILAAWAHLGPPSSHVTTVSETYTDFSGEFVEFRVR